MKKIVISGYYNGGEFELSKDVNEKEINAYFESILNENKISNLNIIEQLQSKIESGHLIYPGGLAFYDDDKIFTTGCCFDLNDVKEAFTNILNSNSTWLGHDPDLTVKFIDDKIIFFESDGFDIDQEPENDEKIEYTRDEINKLINEANNKSYEFISLLYNYLKKNYPDIVDLLIEDLKKLLF